MNGYENPKRKKHVFSLTSVKLGYLIFVGYFGRVVELVSSSNIISHKVIALSQVIYLFVCCYFLLPPSPQTGGFSV